MKRIRLIVIVTVFFLAGISSNAFALGDDPDTRESLYGLTGVCVHSRISKNTKNMGLTDELVLNDARLKFKSAGISVLTEDECSKQPGNPRLVISVDTFMNWEENTLVFRIDLNFVQRAYLKRHTLLSVPAVTWSTGIHGVGSIETIRSRIKDPTDKFINAFLSENPKK